MQFEDWKGTQWDKIQDTSIMMNECKKLQGQVLRLPAEVRSWRVYEGLQKEVVNLLTILPLVQQLHSPSMEDRHWRELKASTGKSFTKGADFCLADLLKLELHKYVSNVEEIVELANKEAKIAAQLAKIELNWSRMELTFGLHKETDIGLIVQSDDVLLALEENMVTLQGMQGQGKYVAYFVEQVTKWQRALGTAEATLVDWLEVQSKWTSLEAIYLGSKDIRAQLPEDSRKFDDVDHDWKELMLTAKSTPNVVEACTRPQRAQLLKSMKTTLEQCQKSLFQYLETKRRAFPRFYFLSDAALLDLLSNGYNPQAVQKHLGDCFDNISRLEYSKEEKGQPLSKTAGGMHSKDGEEYVAFIKPFEAVGAVEDWLNSLVRMMRETLRDIMSRAKFTADHWEIEKPRHEWLFDYPAQVALSASQIIWTEEVGSQLNAFADGNEQAMKEYAKTLAARLEQLINWCWAS